MKKKYYLTVIILVVVVLSGKVILNINYNLDAQSIQDMELSYPSDANIVEKKLVLTNDIENFYINDKIVGEEIRIKTNTLLRVTVINNTNYDTATHFHGVNGLSKYDGVPGITQEAITPGNEFTYEFYLDQPGTYMYHSHVDSSNQVNNEYLFGSLVVEDDEYADIENKSSLIFNTEVDYNAHHNAAGAANFLTVNGQDIDEVTYTDSGDIYLSLVNMSSVPISVNFGENITYTITNVDAHKVLSDPITDQDLIIPSANRVEVLINNPESSFIVSTSIENKNNAQFGINIDDTLEYTDYSSRENRVDDNMQEGMMGQGNEEVLSENSVYLYDVIDMTESLDLLDASPDVSYDFNLGMTSSDGWGINNLEYPKTKEIVITEGDIVEVNLTNDGSMGEVHPFHLHGHEFQVTEYNAQKLDYNLVMDTVNVRPGETITIRFNADNPGIWPLHCHDLTHADKGMKTIVRYDGYVSGLDSEMEH